MGDIKGMSANPGPAEISAALQASEQKSREEADRKRAEKLQLVADKIHDLLIDHDLTPMETQMVFKVINEDIMAITGSTKLTKLYGRHSTGDSSDGGAEGKDEGGERESDSGSEGEGSSTDSEGQDDGSESTSRPGGKGRSA